MSQEDPRQLIGYQLKRVQSALRARMDEGLRPLDLSTPQYVCLELLSLTPEASGSDLARGAFVTRQTMSTLLRGLLDQGLVQRADHPVSGRSLPLQLTAAGRARLAQASKIVRDIERAMIAPLDDHRRRALHEALTLCAQALEEGSDGR